MFGTGKFAIPFMKSKSTVSRNKVIDLPAQPESSHYGSASQLSVLKPIMEHPRAMI